MFGFVVVFVGFFVLFLLGILFVCLFFGNNIVLLVHLPFINLVLLCSSSLCTSPFDFFFQIMALLPCFEFPCAESGPIIRIILNSDHALQSPYTSSQFYVTCYL